MLKSCQVIFSQFFIFDDTEKPVSHADTGFYHLQNNTYPAARHIQNNTTLNIEVEGIRKIKNIPIAAESRAKPIIRFIFKVLTAVVTLTLSYAVNAFIIHYSSYHYSFSKSVAASRISATSSSVTLSSFLVVILSSTSGTRSNNFVIVS